MRERRIRVPLQTGYHAAALRGCIPAIARRRASSRVFYGAASQNRCARFSPAVNPTSTSTTRAAARPPRASSPSDASSIIARCPMQQHSPRSVLGLLIGMALATLLPAQAEARLARPSGGFVVNQGQWAAAARYQTRGQGASVWCLDEGWTLALPIQSPPVYEIGSALRRKPRRPARAKAEPPRQGKTLHRTRHVGHRGRGRCGLDQGQFAAGGGHEKIHFETLVVAEVVQLATPAGVGEFSVSSENLAQAQWSTPPSRPDRRSHIQGRHQGQRRMIIRFRPQHLTISRCSQRSRSGSRRSRRTRPGIRQ